MLPNNYSGWYKYYSNKAWPIEGTNPPLTNVKAYDYFIIEPKGLKRVSEEEFNNFLIAEKFRLTDEELEALYRGNQTE